MKNGQVLEGAVSIIFDTTTNSYYATMILISSFKTD